MTPSDWSHLAEEIELRWREERAQIEAQRKDPKKFPEASVSSASTRHAIRAKAVHVIRVIANDPAIRELVEQQLGAKI